MCRLLVNECLAGLSKLSGVVIHTTSRPFHTEDIAVREGMRVTSAIRTIPNNLMPPPDDWAVAYRKLAEEVGIPIEDDTSVLRSGYEQVARFLQSILDGRALEEAWWEPGTQRWSSKEPGEI